MSKSSKYRFGTKAIHAGIEPDPATGAIMTPIYQTSTYVQSAPGKHKGYEYSRSQNPTREALEKSIAALENADYGHCFASGLAAIDAIIKTLKPGDEVISTNDLYGGTYRIFTKIFQDFGIHFHFINMTDVSTIEKHISEKTKLLWVETPTNPMMNIIDIKGVAEISKKHNITLAVDNTFSTPYLQNPLDLGADLVMHSLTKYIAGHSDVIMGAIATNDKKLSEKLAFIQNASGAVPGPQDCFLVLRGIKTLHLRMQRHCENGAAVANFLKSQPKVDKVFWPGFKSHPNHDIASSQMHDFGGMISFSLKENTTEAATEVLKKFELFTLAESLGGVESLSGHPATMTHASVPKAERDKVGLSDSLIRLSVGVEDVEDLIHDLKQALS
ncbi:cystathionine gamma-synthase [Marivirga sp.]|uniref:cystathionine gamma-synthase n=1 Tax=Marivirga sp. TaxID=2018662 RepID=UPI003DA6EFAB